MVLAGLASCLALPEVLEAQAPEQAAATDTAAVASGLDGSLADLRRGRDRFVDIRDFDAALNPAQAIVDAQRDERDAEYAADLAVLGLIQGQLRQTDQSTANLAEAIDLVVGSEGEYSPTLIQYYHTLGRTYIKAAEYERAIASLEQAQHITQRHLGLYSVEQSPLLDDITTAYLGLGDTLEAHKLQLERLDNAVRRYGADDPRVIPYRYTLAKYYEQSRLPESAREQYQQVLQSQEGRLGSNDVGLLAPLREIVAIDLLLTQTTNRERRDRLAALLEQNPGADPVERGLSLALLGDWSTVAGAPLEARDYYLRAWSALGADPDNDVADYFSKPAMLDFVAPISPVDRAERRRPYTWAEIVLEFNVSADGLPSEIKVISRDQSLASLQSRYSRRLRETHFRPRLVDGEPVLTSHVRSTHYVRRYVSEEEAE